MTKTILLKKEPKKKLAWLTLNRPDKLNAINEDLTRELQKTLQIVEEDKEIRVLIITGAGEKAFSAGADLSVFMSGVTPDFAQYIAAKGHEILAMIDKLPQPVIAAINGYAYGGGCEIALASDFRLAAKRAKIGLTEVNLSLIPAWGGTQRLPRIIGLQKAREAIMFGKRFTAEEALEMGLVDRVFPNDSFEKDVREFAQLLAEQSPIALKLVKQCLNYGTQVPLEIGLAYEAQAFAKTFSTKDLFEGITAFLQKRKPEYKGE
ncbi:MAG: enoyl-CoA hydratase-related protein [Candidatus Hermodarchaeota archaeon]|nr:enoyl-CoA hydratase-related protein [Candidatus Hermodarchaeota archaeon]